jgi:predicted phosphodiesterase
MTKFLVVGDLHGHLDMLEETIQQHPEIDFVLQVGDFGAYFDDGASAKMPQHRRHPSEFPQYASGEKMFSKPVIFIRGNHDGFAYLKQLEVDYKTDLIEITANLFYLPNGRLVKFGDVRIAGIGGNFSPTYFMKAYQKNEDPLKFRHFRISDINALENKKDVDILLTHDAGPDIVPSNHIMSPQCGHLSCLVEKMQPTYWAIGHYHMFYETTLKRTKIYGLNAIHYSGQSSVVLEKR